VTTWLARARREAASALAALRRAYRKLPGPAVEIAERLIDSRKDIVDSIGADLPAALDVMKIRIHGDYHLGQVIVVQNDFHIIDFEGEPRRPLAERRSKESPVRDIAGLLRSFDYAAIAALGPVAQAHPDRSTDLERMVGLWRDVAAAAFHSSYKQTILGCPAYPTDPGTAEALTKLFLIEKVFYELHYELANRPTWVGIPLQGAARLLFHSGER
jgi:maltose alpha-D-glucosyltransferase/alpha-amylase